MGKRRFFENLDGLRFIAFGMVFVAHTFGTIGKGEIDPAIAQFFSVIRGPMWLGVPFFFVLSGFLITYLLIHEKETRGSIRLGGFYMRRILRIWPLHIVLMLFGFVVFPLLDSFFLGEARDAGITEWMYWTFLSNFDQISSGLPNAPGIVVAWSVAIEEQFYLIWPILLMVIHKRHYLFLMLAVIGVSLAGKYGYDLHPKHTVSSMLDLGMGGLLAVLYCNGALTDKWKSFLSRHATIGIYVLGITMLFADSMVHTDLRFGISIFMTFVIFDQCFATNSFFKMHRFKRLSLWGTWTYGLYTLHAIVLFVVNAAYERLPHSGLSVEVMSYLIIPLVTFVLSMVLAGLSFNYFERPFLKMKDRFQS